MSRYQWLVLFAAWLGWGFDVFDGLLFNLVAPVCVPRLLGVAAGDARVGAATGAITAGLLVGWATGGILFGLVTDRLGRSRTLLLTMLTYAIATAACAFATDVWMLAAFRFVAALGIGGEWAAGASLVAEAGPERRRVAAGALLYTSSPLGTFPATLVNDLFTKRIPLLAANQVQPGRARRHARDHPGGAPRPPRALRALPGGRRPVDLGHVRGRLGSGRAHAAPLPGRAHRLRGRGYVQLLSARALPDAAARHRRGLLLQRGPLPGRRRALRGGARARRRADAHGRDPLDGARAARGARAGSPCR